MTIDAPEQSGGSLLLEISNAMVGLQKEFGGKGPDKCRTYWPGPETLLVLMGGGYTAAEETLHQSGQGKAVRESRQAFQDAMERRMIETIERLTGRKVAAFMSASHQGPDLAALLFVLEPDTADAEHPLAAED